MFMVGIEILVFEAKGGLHLRPKPEYGKTFDPNPVVSAGQGMHCWVSLGEGMGYLL